MNEPTCCWPDCQRPVAHTVIPLCNAHYRKVGEQFLTDRVQRGRQLIERSRPDVAARKAERLAQEIERGKRNTERRLRLEAQSVVYYVRIGDRIKIGYTTNLSQRMAALRVEPHNLLATEPGGRRLEAERHEQFADYRFGRREDFIDAQAIREHIQELQERAAEQAS